MNEKDIGVSNITNSFENYRFELIDELPSLLSKVTCEYRDFTKTQNSGDVKSFAAYQTACRAALTHLQLLIKIAMWAQPDIGKNIAIDDESDLDQLILDARTAIQDYKK